LARSKKGAGRGAERQGRTPADSGSGRPIKLHRLLRSRKGILPLAALFVVAIAAVALARPAGTIMSHDPAQPQGLAKVGPINPQFGFPDWYKDKPQTGSGSGGVALEPCLEPRNPLCIIGEVPDPDAPLKLDSADPEQNNFPDEFFYYMADAGMTNVGAGGAKADGRLTLALEGTASNNADQTVFARLRVRIDAGVQPNQTYTIAHPYGATRIKADNDSSLFVTEDIGISPHAFSEALGGRLGPFLRWSDPTTADPREAPDGYVGDPNILHGVKGSPVGQNYFAIIGPNAGAARVAGQICPQDVLARFNTTADNCSYQPLFTLMGKERTRGGVDVQSATYGRDADGSNLKLDVLAESDSSTPPQTIVLRDPDAARRLTADRLFATTQMETANGSFFAHVTVPALAGGDDNLPDEVQVANLTDVPTTVKNQHLVDRITGAASYDTATDTLHVSATSSDRMREGDAPLAKLSLPLFDKGLAPEGAGDQTGDLTPLTAPPATIEVRSSQGGTVDLPVTISGPDSPQAGLRADAGPDLTVKPGDTVNLSGGGSSGNITSYAWSQTSGTSLSLANADQSVAQVKIPAATADGDFGFRLHLTGTPGMSDDDVLVKVRKPATIAETLTPTRQRYTADQSRWVIDGTSSHLLPHRITVYNGGTPGGQVIGAVSSDNAGNWTIDVRNSTIQPVLCPDQVNACVSVRSETGAQLTDLLVDLKAGGGAVVPVGPTPDAPAPPAAAAAAAPEAGPLVGTARAAAPEAGTASAGTAAPATLGAARVAAPATVSAAAVGGQGVPVTVTVPASTSVLRLQVLTTQGKPLFRDFKAVNASAKAQKVTVKLRSKQLQRKLRRGGRYTLEVTPGTSKTRLGKATRKTFRVR
jgi:hypothetical protein